MVKWALWGFAGLLLLLNILLWLGWLNPISLRAQPENLPPAVAEPTSQKAAERRDGDTYVPILMYHYIRNYTDPNDPLGIALSVSPSTFRAQLETIQNAGYQPITLIDFVNKDNGPKPIVLTFDDGYADHYTDAFPLLQQFKMKATFFVVRDFIGRSNYMNEIQIQSLKKAGMEIGGHSISHKNLATESYEEAVADISQSLVKRESVFAYPAGKYSPTTIDILDALGVKAAVTTNLGVATEQSSVLELPRIRIKEKTDILKRVQEEVAISKGELDASKRSKD